MVEVRFADVNVVDNSTSVVEPGIITSADSDGNRADLRDGTLELVRVEVSDVVVVSQLHDIFTLVIIAETSSVIVRVVSLSHKTVVPNVVEDPVGKAATATLVVVTF